MYLKHIVVFLIGISLLVWSVLAGMSEEKGIILYGRQLWFIVPASLMIGLSIFHAWYLEDRKTKEE